MGKGQYERVSSAITRAVGIRLMNDAMARLAAGETVSFDHRGSLFEKDSRFTLSRTGVSIEQQGMISRKALAIEWRHIRMQTVNGRCVLKCYETGKKAAFQMWHMSNNVVFGGLLNFLLDKANYRLLETPFAN